MKTYKKGKNITLKWKLKSTDDSLDLSAYSVELRYITSRGTSVAKGVAIDENNKDTISWTLSTSEQTASGTYSLELIFSQDGNDIIRYSYPNAFALVDSGETNETATEISIESNYDWFIFTSGKDRDRAEIINELKGTTSDPTSAITIYGTREKARQDLANVSGLFSNKIGNMDYLPYPQGTLSSNIKNVFNDLQAEQTARINSDTEINARIAAEENKVGSLADLTTNAQDSIVKAINSVNAGLQTEVQNRVATDTYVGKDTHLNTSAQTLAGAVNELKNTTDNLNTNKVNVSTYNTKIEELDRKDQELANKDNSLEQTISQNYTTLDGRITREVNTLGGRITNESTNVLANSKMYTDSKIRTVNDALALKANSADVYDKDAIDEQMGGKANLNDVYTKSQADERFNVDAVTSLAEGTDTSLTNLISATPYDGELPTLCGQPSILFGEGTPQAGIVPLNWKQFLEGGYDWNGKPSALGQQYINVGASTNARYIAVPDGDFDLKWLNC